ncbi:hypothetical protein POTOM_033981 [Populus tomentosa]|uniref:ATPase F1/V1/A1 complex alpha/beta subunit N-terminal domain-containing protein n=1 Tax=Populus tomentosa TaxID=118781 RepID=A0A8X7Z2C1_POPTO|nr:hypothetical protein POTOM_033981 [Populus tomentosa]
MVTIRADEISNIIRERIEQYNRKVKIVNTGTVLQVGDGIARIYGLDEVMAGELVKFEEGTIGIALNLESNNVGVVLMGDGLMIQEGSSVKATGNVILSTLPYFLSHLTMLEAWMLESRPGNGTLSQLLETFVSSTFPYIVSLNRTVVCWEDFLLDDNTLHFFHLIIPSCNHGTAVQTAQNCQYDPPPPSGDSGSGGSWCGPFKTWQIIYNYDIAYGLTPEETKLVLEGEVALWGAAGLKFQATFMVIVGLISEEIRYSLSLCHRLQNSIKRVQESINIKVYMSSWGETYPHVTAVFQFFDSIHLNSDLTVMCVKRSSTVSHQENITIMYTSCFLFAMELV